MSTETAPSGSITVAPRWGRASSSRWRRWSSRCFNVDLDRIAMTPTSTGEVPNTSPTAGSTGSDLNGWAAYEAAAHDQAAA